MTAGSAIPTLRVNLGDAPLTRLIRSGAVRSQEVAFDVVGPELAYQAFDDMLRSEEPYDAGEIALGTFVEARAFDKPFILVPAVVLARHQHHTLLHNLAATGAITPKGLEGRRVGIRAYSQTTGIWIRGILQHEYDVDPGRVEWVVERGSHVAETVDPDNVTLLPQGSSVAALLAAGELDAAILRDDSLVGGDIRHVIPSPLEAARDWSRRHGVVPVNHLFAVRRSIADRHPGLPGSAYRLLKSARDAVEAAGGDVTFLRFGIEANRAAIALFARFAREQGVVTRLFSVDDLFEAPEAFS